MTPVSSSLVPGPVLLARLAELVSRDRHTTAEMLRLIAEVDARRLFATRGYASMHRYCMRELHMSEDMAAKRIHAARAARKAPAVFDMIADGRLTLSAAWLLAPRLSPHTAGDLLAAATHKTNDQVRMLLAERYPQPDLPPLVRPLAPPVAASLPVPATVPHVSAAAAPPLAASLQTPEAALPAPGPVCSGQTEHAVRHVAGALEPSAPGPIVPPVPRDRVLPLGLRRFGYQFTLEQAAHERPALRGDLAARVRSRHAGRTGRPGDCRQPPVAVPHPQPVGSRARVREVADAGQAREGPSCASADPAARCERACLRRLCRCVAPPRR